MTRREIVQAQADCRRFAWADATDDDLRVVLWNAGDAIRQQRREITALHERLVSQATVLERAEADNERLYGLAFGGQKGGAA